MLDIKNSSGQVLIEIIIAFLLLIFFSLGMTTVATNSLRSVRESMDQARAEFLAQEDTEALRAIVLADWHNLSSLATSSASTPTYSTYVGPGVAWATSTGEVQTSLNDVDYLHGFNLSDVYRSTSTGLIVASGGYYDPSTLKATVIVRWPLSTPQRSYTRIVYFSRYLNNLYTQTDWSGGSVGNASTSVTTTTFATSSGIDATGTSGSILLQLQ